MNVAPKSFRIFVILRLQNGFKLTLNTLISNVNLYYNLSPKTYLVTAGCAPSDPRKVAYGMHVAYTYTVHKC